MYRDIVEEHLRPQGIGKTLISVQWNEQYFLSTSKDVENGVPLKACFAGEYEAYPTKDMYESVEPTKTTFPLTPCSIIFLVAA
jgi:hypothetical protein